MRITRCRISNFSVFSKVALEFSEGINVFIGANGTGKSHLLKILYAVAQWATSQAYEASAEQKQLQVESLLAGLFKPENSDISLLLRTRSSKDVADIEVWGGDVNHLIKVYGDKRHHSHDPSTIAQMPNAKGIFIPPNEVLAIYPGFAASYEKRELAFDQTYYDLCKALAAAPLKPKDARFSQIRADLEEMLQGRVVQQGDRFYVQNDKGNRSLEAHLLAEGHRKIAALVHLIENGSICKETVLFWDEPEANMNPRLVGNLAELLRGLAAVGVQIFVATHDYLLTGELSLAAEYQTSPQVPIRFFAMSRNGGGAVKIQGGSVLADLEDNPILDEFAEHYQREQNAVALSMQRKHLA